MPTYRITKPYTIKSKPIIFNAEMVRSILKGTKTQTRRVLRPQPVTPNAHVVVKKDKLVIYERAGRQPGVGDINATLSFPLLYGNKDDFLWVRESIRRKELSHEYTGATYLADSTAVLGRGSKGSYCGRAICDWYWKRDTPARSAPAYEHQLHRKPRIMGSNSTVFVMSLSPPGHQSGQRSAGR